MDRTETVGEITSLLRRHHGGDRGAYDELLSLVYGQLRHIARIQLARGWRSSTLTPTALVHEVYVQLANETGVEWQHRSHFYAICARAMRRALVDHARHRHAQKRAGGQRLVAMGDVDMGVDTQAELILEHATAVLRRIYERDHPLIATALREFGYLRIEQGRLAEADTLLNEAQRMQVGLLRFGHSLVPRTRPPRGAGQAARTDVDRSAAGETDGERVDRLEMPDHPSGIDARTTLGEALMTLGQHGEGSRTPPAAERGAAVRSRRPAPVAPSGWLGARPQFVRKQSLLPRFRRRVHHR